MPYLTLVSNMPWNWKWLHYIKMGLGIMFLFHLANILLVINGYTTLNFTLMDLLNISKHLVAKGFTQTYSIDYDEILSLLSTY